MSKLEIKGAWGLVLLMAVLMICCGSTSSGGGFANVDVQYSISGDRISHNANESQDYFNYFLPGVGTDYRKLIWFCGNYKDHQRSRVDLTFKKENNTWVLDKVEYSGGSCG